MQFLINVILYTHPKTVSMYEKMGFRRQKTGMAIYNGNAESLSGWKIPDFFWKKAIVLVTTIMRDSHMYRQEASDKSRKNRIRQRREGKRL